jgi:hypothetical protein
MTTITEDDVFEIADSHFTHGVIYEITFFDNIGLLPYCNCWEYTYPTTLRCSDECEIQLSEILKFHYESACLCRSISYDEINDDDDEDTKILYIHPNYEVSYNCSACHYVKCKVMMFFFCYRCNFLNQHTQYIDKFIFCEPCNSDKKRNLLYSYIKHWHIDTTNTCCKLNITDSNEYMVCDGCLHDIAFEIYDRVNDQTF